jgi:hypothetical protein
MIPEGIVVAIIGSISAVAVALIQKHRRESNQSNEVMFEKIDRLDEKIDNVTDRVFDVTNLFAQHLHEHIEREE